MNHKRAAIFAVALLCAASARAQDAAPAAAEAVSTVTVIAPITTQSVSTAVVTVPAAAQGASTFTVVVIVMPPPASPIAKWKDSAEGSFVSTNGNSKATTTSGKDSFLYNFDPMTRLDLEGGGLGSRSAGQVTAEQYHASEQLQRKYDESDYVFERYHWDKNRFAGIASRHEVSLGVGRTLWKTPSNLLTLEIAPGFVNEERIGSRTRDFPSARVYSKYVHTLSPTANFSQDAEYIQNLRDTGDLRLNTETAVTAALTSRFSLKCSYVWKHASEPPPSFIKDDTITSIALIANF